MYEGQSYNLPLSLQWSDVIDLEGVTAVELGALPGSRLDGNLLNRAICACNMKKRSEEEVDMAITDMKNAAQLYTAEHTLLCLHIDRLKLAPTSYASGCLNITVSSFVSV